MLHGSNWYKRYPADHLGGVQGMSAKEHAVYNLVLDSIYVHGGATYNDPKYFAGLIKDMGTAAVRNTISDLVAKGKLIVEESFLTQNRAKTESKTREETAKNFTKNPKKRSVFIPNLTSHESDNNDLDHRLGEDKEDKKRLNKTLKSVPVSNAIMSAPTRVHPTPPLSKEQLNGTL